MTTKKALAGAAAAFAGIIGVFLAVFQIANPGASHGAGVAAVVVFVALLVGSIWYLFTVPPLPPPWVRRGGWVAVAVSAVGLVVALAGVLGFRIYRTATPLPTPTPTGVSPDHPSSPEPTQSASPSPTSSPTPSPVVKMTHPTPGSTTTVRASYIEVSGVAHGLQGDQLWLFDHDINDGYTRDNDSPLQVNSDGSWSFTDDGLNAGSTFQLILVRANKTCARFVQSIRADADGSHFVDNLDVSCAVIGRATIKVS